MAMCYPFLSVPSRVAKALQGLLSFIPHRNPARWAVIIPILHIGKLRLREVRLLAQLQ